MAAMSTDTGRYLTIAGISVALGIGAYALYFDYQRRNDSSFRRKLRRDQRRLRKAASEDMERSNAETAAALRAAVIRVAKEGLPEGMNERERYFMENVAEGERLAGLGADKHVDAAISFYQATKVYPNQIELIEIYQKTVPAPVFELIMSMIAMETRLRQESYFSTFPPESMKVQIAQVADGGVTSGGKKAVRRALLTREAHKAGNVIYLEKPVVSALEIEVENAGTNCSYCFRYLEKAQLRDGYVSNAAFCSSECLSLTKAHWQDVLYGEASTAAIQSGNSDPRPAFLEMLSRRKSKFPLLVARFVATQIYEQQSRLVQDQDSSNSALIEMDIPESTLTDVTSYDHIEKLRFLDIGPTAQADEERLAILSLLRHKVPDMEMFLTKERYLILKGKMSYNAIGVNLGNSSPHSDEMVRNEDPSEQVGAGLYRVSSYLGHSCSPNAQIRFQNGTNQLTLIALKDLKPEEELTVAFVPIISRPLADRRQELLLKWRFICRCSSCSEEKE